MQNYGSWVQCMGAGKQQQNVILNMFFNAQIHQKALIGILVVEANTYFSYHAVDLWAIHK